MDDMLKRKMGAFVAGLISKNHWRTIDVIDRISTPMMFITGLKDAMIPKEFGNKALAEKATSTKFKVMVRGYRSFSLALILIESN